MLPYGLLVRRWDSPYSAGPMTDNLAHDPSAGPNDRAVELASVSDDLKRALAGAEQIDDALLCARVHSALDRVAELKQIC